MCITIYDNVPLYQSLRSDNTDAHTKHTETLISTFQLGEDVQRAATQADPSPLSYPVHS